jgi:TatD DNase family protein
MFIDSHCHVHFRAYENDMDAVIQRALDQGIFLITVGTQSDTSRAGLEVAERYDGMWASVGLHPNHLTQQSFVDEQEMIHTREETFDPNLYASLAVHPKCVAIGETGLDYYRIPEHADRNEVMEMQRRVFRQHARLATDKNKPIIIHCRDAYDEQADLVAELIQAGLLQKRGVVHCFTGTLEQAQRFIELGFMISFSGVVTFPARKNDVIIDGLTLLQYTAREIPLDVMLIETDAPYLTPVPNRGKRNEPANVRDVAVKIAELKGIDVEEVGERTTQNAMMLFVLSSTRSSHLHKGG